MTTPVSFELAKLLKENEFDKITNFSYNSVGIISSISNRNSDGLFISAPNIAEVVMWLYEKYGIWIGVQPNEPYVDDDWCFTIFKNLKNNKSLEGYNSPTEAYEAAILYTLKNLINERI